MNKTSNITLYMRSRCTNIISTNPASASYGVKFIYLILFFYNKNRARILYKILNNNLLFILISVYETMVVKALFGWSY
jgi:hypothetical protein